MMESEDIKIIDKILLHERTFNLSNDAIFVVNSELDEIIECNGKACELLSYSYEELLSKKMSEIHTNEIHELLKFTNDVSKVGYGWSKDFHCKTKDGSKIPVEISASKMQYSGKECIIVIVKDISETYRNQSMINTAVDAMITIDERGTIVSVNPAFQEVFGYVNEEEYIGQNVNMLMTKDDSEKHNDYLEKYKLTGRASIIGVGREATGKRKDGSEFPIFLSVGEFSMGERTYYSGIVLDISSLKKAQEGLERSEEKFRQLADAIEDVFWIFSSDGSVMHYISPGYESIWGKSCQHLYENPHDWIASIHPEDRALVMANFVEEKLIRDGFDMEYRIIREDGSLRYIHDRGSPILSEKGIVHRIAGVATDITKRKQTEKNLELYKHIDSSMADATIITDLEGKITHVNNAHEEMYGYSVNELLGETPVVLNAEYLAKEIQNEILAFMKKGKRWRGEVLQKRKDGSTFYIESNIFNIRKADGEVIAYASISKDITEQKRMQSIIEDSKLHLEDLVASKTRGLEVANFQLMEEIQNREKLEQQMLHTQKMESLGVLTGGIAHDFNNMLQSVFGNAGLLKRELPSGSDASGLVENIIYSSERLKELIDELLAYSGKSTLKKTTININEIISDMKDLLCSAISKKTTLTMEFDKDMPYILADVTQFRQIVLNFVTNASDSLEGKKGSIMIKTNVIHVGKDYLDAMFLRNELDVGSYVSFEVSDSGKGMDEVTRQKLFDPFFTTKEAGAGHGLGLSAILGIVRSHNGGITLKSELGRGTSFQVVLPASDIVHTENVKEPAKSTKKLEMHGLALVIDDDERVRSLLTFILKANGFTVIEAENGLQGVELFQRHQKDLRFVILDMAMPEMSGEEAFREMKKYNVSIPVILNSGFAESAILNQFKEEGIAGFLKKPWTPEDLNAMIERILLQE